MLHPLWAIDRSGSETDQLHAIFTNTADQLEKSVIPAFAKWLPGAGISWVYDKRPPLSWFRRWDKLGIRIPEGIARYRKILTLSTGFHSLMGTLFKQSFTQYESLEFRSIRFEEMINSEKKAILGMIERMRCGDGAEHCLAHHRHQAYGNFNPPRGAHPWLYGWLDELEEAAKKHYSGPALNHRAWPLLKGGIGQAILIQSRTSDNRKNLMHGYEDGLAANYSAQTAKRRLDGEIIREVAGRAYTEYDQANVHPVSYDPTRELYVFVDFNVEPRVAAFGHELRPGEYPIEHYEPGLVHIGIFGEFFAVSGGMGDRKFAEAVYRGDRGIGGRYADEDLRGLPENWQGLREHSNDIVGFGDAVGRHRSVHSDNLESSWEIIDSVWRQKRDANWEPMYRRRVPEANPAPRARVDAVNGKFLNRNLKRSLWIDPRCSELLKDFEQVMWDDEGKAIREWRRGTDGDDGEAWHRTHLSDAVGYGIHEMFPLGHEERDDSLSDKAVVKQPKRRRRPDLI